MTDTLLTDIKLLKRDLSLRGYNQEEVEQLLNTPFFLIPGPITLDNETRARQKLTNHQILLCKDFMKEGIPCEIVEHKDEPRRYVEERHAHIDLGTVVVGVMTAYQLGAFANIAQILDFTLNLIQFRFSRGRSEHLMPNVRFELEVHNRDKMIRLKTEVPADKVTSLLKSKGLLQLVTETFELTEDG